MAGKIQVIVGGQYGSEGKGHAAGALARREGELFAIRTGGPNAGHTVVDDDGKTFKLRQLPVAVVTRRDAMFGLATRSLVQLELLEEELKLTGQPEIRVDRAATILETHHIETEVQDPALAWGSTQKGIGAARADRIHRTAMVFGEDASWILGARSDDVAETANTFLTNNGGTVQIEAAQGYGLGLHTSYYPKTTSADCRAIDALADVGISPWNYPDTALEIWVVIRPYPIRVAGDSGPLLDETSWAALGLPEERTTVTNKVRRVGGWDPLLVRDAVEANGRREVRLWVNMADHVWPWLAGVTSFDSLSLAQRYTVMGWISTISAQTGAPVHALGTGPATEIMFGGYR